MSSIFDKLLYDKLKNEKCNIKVHDPHIKYWEEKKVYSEDSLGNAFEGDIDILIISTKHKEYTNFSLMKKIIINQRKLFILDCQALFNENEIKEIQKKHIVKILGRGDI